MASVTATSIQANGTEEERERKAPRSFIDGPLCRLPSLEDRSLESPLALNRELLGARWALGLVRAEELPRAATDALAAGFDGPALRTIAGTLQPRLEELWGRFESALREVGAPQMGRTVAAEFLARCYAEDIITGMVSPHEGARKIWKEAAHELRPADHTLDPFIYWADEYEEASDDDRRQVCRDAIVENARMLVRG
jgi:hypothetical protein